MSFFSLTAESLNQPNGFCFVWAGARANHGVTSGKVLYSKSYISIVIIQHKYGWAMNAHTLNLYGWV